MAKNFKDLAAHSPVSVQLISPVIVAADANGFSDLVYIGGSSIVAIQIPAGWTGADLVVWCAVPDGSQVDATKYKALYKQDGTRYVIKVAAADIMIQINPYDFVGLDAIQLQSVSTSAPGTPVQQSAGRTLVLVTIGNGTF